MSIVWPNIPLDTLKSCRRLCGDCGISQDYSASQLHSATAQCVRCWVAPLLACGVLMCYLKGFVYVYFRCSAKTVGFSGTRLYLCVYNKPSWAILKHCLPPGWVVTREDYSLVVTCTRRRSICYPYSRHPLQTQAPLNLGVMACHSLERTQACPKILSHSMPAGWIELKNPLPDLDLNPKPARILRRTSYVVHKSIGWLKTQSVQNFNNKLR